MVLNRCEVYCCLHWRLHLYQNPGPMRMHKDGAWQVLGEAQCLHVQATLESSRKAAVPGKPTAEDLGGQLAFAQSAQAAFEVRCLTRTVFVYFTAFLPMPFNRDRRAHTSTMPCMT